MKKNKNSILKNQKNPKGQLNTEFIKKNKLTRKQKKAFAKVLENKIKTQKRMEMLNELKNFQLSAPLLSLMTSISQTQTIGLRNATKEKKKHQSRKPVVENSSSDEMVVNEDEDVKTESSNNDLQ